MDRGASQPARAAAGLVSLVLRRHRHWRQEFLLRERRSFAADAGGARRRRSADANGSLEQSEQSETVRTEGACQMGAFNINITGVGGHGCERKAKAGEKLYGRCGRFTCPDCIAYEFVQRMKQASS